MQRPPLGSAAQLHGGEGAGALPADAFTHVFDLPPQIGGCEFSEEGEAVAGQLDGSAPGAWRLPLGPLSATSLECHAPGVSAPAAAQT